MCIGNETNAVDGPSKHLQLLWDLIPHEVSQTPECCSCPGLPCDKSLLPFGR